MIACLFNLAVYCLIAIPLMVRFSGEPWYMKFAMCFAVGMLVDTWLKD